MRFRVKLAAKSFISLWLCLSIVSQSQAGTIQCIFEALRENRWRDDYLKQLKELQTHYTSKSVEGEYLKKTEDIIFNPNLAPEQVIKEIADKLIRTRLEYLPKEVQDKVNAALVDWEKDVLTSQSKWKLGSRIDAVGGKDGIQVNLPPALRGTVVESMIRVHEVEHVIQDSLPRLMGVLDIIADRGQMKVFQRYEIEKGAIIAERQLAVLIPSEIVDAEVARIKSDKTLSIKEKVTALTFLKSVRLDPDAYHLIRSSLTGYSVPSLYLNSVMGAMNLHGGNGLGFHFYSTIAFFALLIKILELTNPK